MFDGFIRVLIDVLRAAFSGMSVSTSVIEIVSKTVSDTLVSTLDRGELGSRDKIDRARHHMKEAGALLDDLRSDLTAQAQALEELSVLVESKRKDAARYEALVSTKRESIEAIRVELESAIQSKLEEQARKGRRMRQFVAAIIWLVTLVAGAALGTYFPRIVAHFSQ